VGSAAEQAMRAARAKVYMVRPYFAKAIFSHVLVESPAVPTLGVDRHRRLYYNPTFVLSLPIDQLVTCLLHEVGHTLRCDHDRARMFGVTEATAALANIAQDAAINDDLRQEVVKLRDLAPLPDFAIYPEQFGEPEDEPWEYYYTKLLARERPDFGVDCGSGAHGVSRPWEHGNPALPGQADGVSDADWQDVIQQTAQAIASYAQSRGTVPGSWVEWAKTVLRPRIVPWDHVLGGHLRWAVADTRGAVFHSYKRPSRRASVMPEFCLPSMRAPRPMVAVVGDTSGSMDLRALALVRGVVQDVCGALGVQVVFLATDAGVHGGPQHVHHGRDVQLLGRGGTDMCVGIEYALTHLRPRPDSILVVTDCETPWPVAPLPAGCKLIVAAVGDSPAIERVPTWARLVRVDPDVTGRRV
jgi:predicted metal-dependent peptidase